VATFASSHPLAEDYAVAISYAGATFRFAAIGTEEKYIRSDIKSPFFALSD
jgi:hypothetical protein